MSKNLYLVFDFIDYIKYFVIYGKEKNKNGQTTAKSTKQKNGDCYFEAERGRTQPAWKRSKSKKSVNIELFAGMLAEIEG